MVRMPAFTSRSKLSRLSTSRVLGLGLRLPAAFMKSA
jgi:hypothetical protein